VVEEIGGDESPCRRTLPWLLFCYGFPRWLRGLPSCFGDGEDAVRLNASVSTDDFTRDVRCAPAPCTAPGRTWSSQSRRRTVGGDLVGFSVGGSIGCGVACGWRGWPVVRPVGCRLVVGLEQRGVRCAPPRCRGGGAVRVARGPVGGVGCVRAGGECPVGRCVGCVGPGWDVSSRLGGGCRPSGITLSSRLWTG
jgi:hypothetical protein